MKVYNELGLFINQLLAEFEEQMSKKLYSGLILVVTLVLYLSLSSPMAKALSENEIQTMRRPITLDYSYGDGYINANTAGGGGR